MKIVSVTPFKGKSIFFEGIDSEYIRYGATCWKQCYGDEQVDCIVNEEFALERIYQEWESLNKEVT